MKSVGVFALLFSVSLANDKYDSNQFKFENGYVDNPDNYEEIVRPCQVYDLNCIRRFFAKHSKCQIRNGPVPKEYVRGQFSSYLVGANLTFTTIDDVITGLDKSRIEEFYYNKATDKVVIAIQARDLKSTVNSTYFRFYRRGREPVTAVSSTSILYSSLVITAVIPNTKDLQFHDAEITSYAPQPLYFFTLGPEVLSNPDPTVINSLAELFKDENTNLREQQLTETAFYAVLYIQTNICDFGLKFS